MYSIALEALDISHSKDDAKRCDILMAVAGAQQELSDVAGAQESLRQAAEIAQRSGTGRALPISCSPPRCFIGPRQVCLTAS